MSNQQQANSNNNLNGNNNIENQVWIQITQDWSVHLAPQAPNEEMMNGNHTEEEKRNKKNKTKTKRNENEKLEEISKFCKSQMDTILS